MKYELDQGSREGLKQAFGMTDAELDRTSSNVAKIFANFANMAKYEIVAEVVSSKYCYAGCQPGQKIVFGSAPPVIKLDKTDCPLCQRGVGPLTGAVNIIMDRLVQGVDPSDLIWPISECLDPGLDAGGMGKVIFKVYAREVQ